MTTIKNHNVQIDDVLADGLVYLCRSYRRTSIKLRLLKIPNSIFNLISIRPLHRTVWACTDRMSVVILSLQLALLLLLGRY